MSKSAELPKQRILVIPNEQVADLFRGAFFYPLDDRVKEITKSVEMNGKFIERDYAESTTKVKQVIAYTLIRNNSTILILRRSKKSNRDSLKLKNTILFGGHVDDLDDEPGNRLIKCMYRELSEELNIQPKITPKLLGLAIDPTTDVGSHHLGVIFDTEISGSEVFLNWKKDISEFTKFYKNYCVELVEAKSLLNNFKSFDKWSTLFFRSSASNFLFGPKPRRNHKELTLAEYEIY
jgi:predicted NUDIX family phosphoesterase